MEPPLRPPHLPQPALLQSLRIIGSSYVVATYIIASLLQMGGQAPPMLNVFNSIRVLDS